MKKKIYVSLPMTGQFDTVRQRCLDAEKNIRQHDIIKDFDVVFPFDAMKVGTQEQDDTKTLGYWLGKDIELLMECDAIYLCKGWIYSKGCNLEHSCALLYGKSIFEER